VNLALLLAAFTFGGRVQSFSALSRIRALMLLAAQLRVKVRE
jgi:hypothetical protein